MIYLDNAATSFIKPLSVKRAVINAMNTAASPGRGGYKEVIKASEIVYQARENLARLFNISTPERIMFTNNATAALNTGIKGSLNAGESLLISSMEHNAVLRPSKEMERRGVRLKIVRADENGYVSDEEIKRQMKYGVKLVSLIHASNVCGSINDIKKIGETVKEYGGIFMVDASQSAGCIPIDADKCKIDILCFPGHKGLYGPQGTGGIYVREGISLRPLTEGGTGSMSESYNQPEILPDRFESGTLNVPGIAGLSEGCRFVLNHGAENIGKWEREHTRVLAEDLSVVKEVKILGDPMGSSLGVLSIVTPVDSVELARMLSDNFGICVRAGLHCAPMAHKTLGSFETGSVRFSPGVFTKREDIKKTALAVERCLRNI